MLKFFHLWTIYRTLYFKPSNDFQTKFQLLIEATAIEVSTLQTETVSFLMSSIFSAITTLYEALNILIEL